MTKHEASNLLDRVRAGDQRVKRRDIDFALCVLGDMDDFDEQPEQLQTPAGSWELTLAHLMRPAAPFDGLAA